jgi:mono/diheme cytochrome c family protein
MVPSCPRLLVILLASSAALSLHGQQGPAAVPPAITTPPLSPADEMKTFRLPAGFRVELVASEPLVEEPVLIDFDPDGRLWVLEMRGYMQDLPATNETAPVGRVSVLEDRDGDGRMDKKTVFLDGLVQPRALKVLDRGVLVAEPPHLWFARDTNGDLRADTKDEVSNAYGRADANAEHNANSLLWALDNWMHTSEGDIYLRYKGGKFEVRKTLSRGQWGASQDDAGRIYRNSNESVLHVDIVPTPYYARNPNLARTRGSYESLRGDNNENMTVFPAHPTPAVNRGYQAGVLRPDGTLAAYSAAAAPTVFRGDNLPADLYGNVFVVEPAGNLVSRLIVTDNGSGLSARRAYDGTEFLTSTDERFRPVYLSNAPDGTLYLVDMYRGIVQHRSYVTEYLRDQILSRNLQTPIRHGRIYRIVHESTQPRQRPAYSRESPATLVTRLGSPNGWVRDTAQRLLVERGDRSVIPALRSLATDTSADLRARRHALWTLDGLDAIDEETVLAVGLKSPDLRATAVRLAERWLPTVRPGAQEAIGIAGMVIGATLDRDWSVRRQAAASISVLSEPQRSLLAMNLLRRFDGDPIVVDATLSGFAGSEPALLKLLTAKPSEEQQPVNSITMLAAAIFKKRDGAEASPVLAMIAEDDRPASQRAALLSGAELALAPARQGGRGAGGATGSAPPGARGGPGGAPAFPAPAGASRGASGAPLLKLPAEPAIVAFAGRDSGELGRRAEALLARLDWPGKPSTTPAAAPLTAEEQQRFTAGRQVYQTLCSACHQPDGQGQEKLAPSLIGSELALGRPDLPVRIVLNGKEGPVGLMPPIGAALSDDQIAAALTYIRREWGHTASAVAPALVKEVRSQTAGRARPWTNDELKRTDAK